MSAGQASAGLGEADSGRARLVLGHAGVRYYVRTICMGPCYGAIDAKRSGRHTYATAASTATAPTPAPTSSPPRLAPITTPISKATVGPGQWWHSPVWYLDSHHNATVCVSIDGMNGACTKPY